jgi:hypothetical protein
MMRIRDYTGRIVARLGVGRDILAEAFGIFAWIGFARVKRR